MRIAILSCIYSEMITYLYRSFPDLNVLNFQEQKKIIDENGNLWASGWENALNSKQVEVINISANLDLFLQKWNEAEGFPKAETSTIIINLLKKFKPDILFYDFHDISLLKKIKHQVPSIRKTMMWTGSAIINESIFKEFDLTLSCAPEVVHYLKGKGIKAEHLNHAFNKLSYYQPKKSIEDFDIIFIGQVFRAIGFHFQRELILKELVDKIGLKVFSSAYNLTKANILFHLIKKSRWLVSLPFLVGLSIANSKYNAKYEKAKRYPFLPYSLSLKKGLMPPVYGKEMYDAIASSKVVLNLHADSSPEFASNMRLFETTGVGSCLLTDWKKNITDLFQPEKEIITFSSIEECIEKAKYLISHEKERNEIAQNGQKRTFKDHLYEHRVSELLEIIEKHLL